VRKSAKELLAELNATDEQERIEAKRCKEGNPGKAVRKTVISFSNEPALGGGHIVFGVTRNEDGLYKIVGVDDPDKLQTAFNSQCSNDYNVQVRPSLGVEEVDGKSVVVAWIPEVDPEKKPVYLKDAGLPDGAYRRIGSADQTCTEEDVSELYALRKADEYEMTVLDDAGWDDIDSSAVEEYREVIRGQDPGTEILDWDDEELLRATGSVRRGEDGRLEPTVAGVLLFGEKWSLRRLFPSMYVDYVRVKGTEWVQDADRRYEDSVEIREPLVRSVRKAASKVVDELPTPFSLNRESFQRKDEPVIPVTVIREAVANALMHRSYRHRGPTQIIRYDNRIEVRNPGHSLKPREELHEPGSRLRNPTIANVLRELGFAENKGSGVQTMRRLMQDASLTPPTFESNRRANRFVATFLFQHFMSDDDIGWLEQVDGVEPKDPAALALLYVRETGRIDNSKLRDLAGLETLEASQCLRDLRDQGLLEMQGGGAATYYEPGSEFSGGAVERETGEGDKAAAENDKSKAATDKQSHKPSHKESHKASGWNERESENSGVEGDKQSHKQSHKQTLEDFSDEARELLNQFPGNVAAKIVLARQASDVDLLRKVIVTACGDRWLSAKDLATLFDRERRHLLRAHVGTLLEEGRLKREYPDSRKHPKQRYKAADDGVES